MPPTTGYSFGDVVLVPFPFTNQAGTKKRPAVIISGAAYNAAQRDLIIMAVTSQLRPSGALGEAQVAEWQAAGLIKPSAIKPVITTIEQALVLRRLGQLTTEDQQTLRNAVAKILG
ncbi:MAG: type II toxin-antitoxin system PemK/MazF family toxin [Burkholderiales bacterium]